MKSLIVLVAALSLSALAEAADVEAGKAKVQAVCAACHGTLGGMALTLAATHDRI
jgi:mono/diheme cytochrome c family protein